MGKKFKILQASNFDNEMVDDILIADNMDNDNAELICDFFNENFAHPNGIYYYQIVVTDFILHEFKP